MPFDDSSEGRQVRLAVQRILQLHLRPDLGDACWADIDLDLAGARLSRLNFSRCRIRSLNRRGAVFTEPGREAHRLPDEPEWLALRFVDDRPVRCRHPAPPVPAGRAGPVVSRSW